MKGSTNEETCVHRVHKACLMNMTGQQDNTVMDIGVMDNSGATITYSFDANSNPQRASVAIFYQNLVEAGVIAKWWVIAKPDADSPDPPYVKRNEIPTHPA
jgi:hypothetical protein